MFNLLPEKEKRRITLEYRARLSVVIFLFITFLGSVALVALIPSFFISYQREAVLVKKEGQLEKQSALLAKDQETSVLKSVKQKIAVLEIEKTPTYTYELFGRIIQNQVSGIKINGMNLENGLGGAKKLTIVGKAKNRDVLFLFKQNLEKEKNLEGVTVPPSDFASATDINFTVLANVK